MADVFTKAKRSEVMARIRSRGNRDTELALAALLRAHKVTGWRRHQLVRGTVEGSSLRFEGKPRRRNTQRSTFNSHLTVRPDFVFPKQRTVIFVDGCFWHGCPKHSNPKKWLQKSSMPVKPASAHDGRTGRAFWQAKLVANQARDRKVNRLLRRAGWRVVRIWEHELKKSEVQSVKCEPPKLIRRIQRALNR